MKHIGSRDNPLFKRLRRLAEGKSERHNGADEAALSVLLEGVHLCQAWLQHRGVPELVIFDESRLAASSELQQLARQIPSHNCIALESRLAAQLSDVDHGQGVYALVTIRPPSAPLAIAETCLWLDRVQDPGNVGTMLRTAAAAGIEQVFLSNGCAGAWSAKVLRSGQGAHFALDIFEGVDLLALCERLQIPLLATALDNSASCLYELDLSGPCAWLVGNEGRGVAPALVKKAAHTVFIPQAAGVESLNVAVAAAVCLFEQRRQSWVLNKHGRQG